jgi:hypothetical protein
MQNNPSTFDGAKDKYESLPLTELVILVSEYISELENWCMNRELVEGTAVISSLNFTFTYPTAQPKDLICKKIYRFVTFPRFVFVFQLNVLMC